ncbi:hypothetical protein [Knoellia remsis]|uniref:hypothetical protein n=1 Tax=Knoellia remsis TaxID=407159 RepID=UPI0011B221E7|nr:hypothetical protein [Knoellia remsis]
MGIWGPILLAVGVVVFVKCEWWGAPLAAFSLYMLADLWRKVAVTPTTLTAQGRITRKTVALADIEDAGVSPMSIIWVQPRDQRAFDLRMVSQYGKAGAVGVADFAPRLEELVRAAGGSASLDLDHKRPHPEGTHPTFSA